MTGEVGYEFFFPVESGKAQHLWRRIREVGREYGLRELGFRAQMVGHTEINLATAIRDYIPTRMPADRVHRFAKHWMSHEEGAALSWGPGENFFTPYELCWGSLVNLETDLYGHDALREAAVDGPGTAFVGLEWASDDVLSLFGEQFEAGDIAPPPELPAGQFRIEYLLIRKDGERVGWASGHTYSPNLRKMLSVARIPIKLAERGTEVDIVWGGFTPDNPERKVRAAVEPDAFVTSKERGDPRP